jgi:uncharacterized RDD family membrane protein YckC
MGKKVRNSFMRMERHSTLIVKTPEGIVFTLILAGPVSRFLAFSIDVACVMILSNIVGAVVGAFRAIYFDAAAAVAILLFFVISIAYGVAFEWYGRGQTIGKRLMGLRVMDAQGLRLQFSQIVIRNLLRVVDSLPAMYLVGGMACFLSPLAQRLGDLAANTIVVRNPKMIEPNLGLITTSKYNSFRDDPYLVARLRQRISPREAGIALQTIMRRDEIEPRARVELFQDIAEHFHQSIRLPEESAQGLTDEQYVRNIVDILFIQRARHAGADDGRPLAGDNYIYPLTTITLTHEKQV